MAFTIQQYESLKAAIAEGALTVKYADKQVTYRSLDEMLRILKMMADELDLNPCSTGGVVYPAFSKGLHIL